MMIFIVIILKLKTAIIHNTQKVKFVISFFRHDINMEEGILNF